MKLTIFLILISVLGVFASKTYSQTKVLRLEMKNSTIKEVLQNIEDQSEFVLMYSEKVVDVKRKVSISIEDKKINEVLDELFAGTDVNYKVKDRFILLASPEVTENDLMVQQQNTITGTVTDESGKPIPGVTVIVKGTIQGTVTNAEGNYSLTNLPENATLQFSFVGMRSEEVVIGNQTNINVTLVSEAIGLEEVVAIGYGVQKKVNLTGSVSHIQIDKEMENRPITNMSQALVGTMSGVWAHQTSGQPGKDEAQIRIRGWGTLNNAEALVIVDGVEGSFSEVNPNDIESISVLKDAASAAIYGSKAANGVILITTKSGSYNEELVVNFSLYGGVQQLGRRYDMITNTADFMEIYNQSYINKGLNPPFAEDKISTWRSSDDSYTYPNTDWYEVLFRTAPITESNLSISGGSSNITTFISLNYLNQKGLVENTDGERYRFTANIKANPLEWFTLGCNLNYSNQVANEPYDLERTFANLSYVGPYYAPYTEDGRFGSVQLFDTDGLPITENLSPIIGANVGEKTIENTIGRIQVNAGIKFNDNLEFNTVFASKSIIRMSSSWNETLYGYTTAGHEMVVRGFHDVSGILRDRNIVKTTINDWHATINYHNNNFINKNHDLSALAGMQYIDDNTKTLSGQKKDPTLEILTQIDAGTTSDLASGNMYGLRTLSYFGRINYKFLNKFLFETNIRADASSRFKEGNRWGIFPGMSLGWRLSEEEFIQDLDIFSNLQLRFSYGKLGNQNIAGYWPYLDVINQNNSLSYSYNANFAPGAAITSLIDENITWEHTTSGEVGLDMGLLDNKIILGATYFNKETSNIIVKLPIPLLMGGVSPPYENEGKMLNKGFELDINYKNYADRQHFGVNINANLTYVHNEVTKFRGGDSPDQLYLIREGYSYNSFYGFNVVGIYQSDEEAAEHMYSNSYQPHAGELKYEDVNKDGKLDYQDKQGLGNTIPSWTFGLNPKFTYKGFDLAMLFQGSADFNIFTRNSYTTATNNTISIHEMWKDGWTPQNTDTNIPAFKIETSWDWMDSNFWMHNISYVKLKNIQLGYTWSNITSKLGLEETYFFANAQNVFTVVDKEYPGYDPEGFSSYPLPRIITLGVNFKF